MMKFYYVEKRQLNWRFWAWGLVVFVLSVLTFCNGRGKIDYAISGVFFAGAILLLYLSDRYPSIKKLPLKCEEIGEGSQ